MQSCRTAQQAASQATQGRRKVSWSSAEESVIRSRSKAQRKLHELAKQSPTSQQQAQEMAIVQAREAALREEAAITVDMLTLKPDEFSKLDNVLAREIGVHMKQLGLGDELTQAGSVKLSLVEMQRRAKSLVEMVGRYASVKGQRESVAAALHELEQVGVRGSQAKEFINNVIEVSLHPRVRRSYGTTPANELILSRRYNDMRAEAKQLGLTDTALDNIMLSANNAAKVFDDMRDIGNVLGQSIDEVQDIGYVYREFSQKAKDYFEVNKIASNQFVKPGLGSTPMAESRSTWQLTPTDMQALSEVLTGKGVKSWDAKVKELIQTPAVAESGSAVEQGIQRVAEARKQLKQARAGLAGGAVTRDEARLFAKELRDASKDLSVTRKVAASNKQGTGILSYSDILAKNGGDDTAAMKQLADNLGMTVDDLTNIRATHDLDTADTFNELTTLWNDGLAFTEHLNKNVSAQQLDDLVDAGILSKVPMTTREVYDYMSRQYSLPWTKKGVEDLFELDLEKRTNSYREKLSEAAGQSYMVQNIVTEGTAKGWAVPTNSLLPGEHDGFKELSGIDLTRFGLDPKMAESWGGMHVHPTVYNQLEAQLNMMTKPGVLSTFGQALLYVNKNFNIITLGGNGIPFLSRNVYGGMRSSIAAGGNPARIPVAMREVMQVLEGGLPSMDNVGEHMMSDGKWLTKQEAFKRFMVLNGSSYVGVESGVALGVGVAGNAASRIKNYALDVGASLPRAIQEMREYAAMHPDFISGLVGASKKGAKQFDEYVSKVFAPIAYGNALSDISMQWATLNSIMEVKGVQDNVRKGLQLVSDKHSFTNMEDAFAHMRNYFIDHASLGTVPKAIAKYVKPFGVFAMMSPALTLRHAMRNPSQFVAYSRLVRMQADNYQKDPDMREAGFSEWEMRDMPITLFKDVDGKSVLSLSPSNWDSFNGSAVYGLTQAQRISRLMGNKSMSFGEQDRKEMQGDKYTLLDFVRDNMGENNNPIFAAAAELIGGQDKFKRDIDKIPFEVGGAKVDPSLGWFLSKLPGFASLNRAIGGRGVVTDATGKVLSPAQPGLFGTPQRPATSTETSNFEVDQKLGAKQGDFLRNVAGLKVTNTDLAKGRQRTLTDVRRTIVELDKQAKKLYDTVEPSPQRTKDIELLQNQALQMTVEAYRVDKWMREKGVAEGEAIKELDKLSIRARSEKITTPEMEAFIKKAFGDSP